MEAFVNGPPGQLLSCQLSSHRGGLQNITAQHSAQHRAWKAQWSQSLCGSAGSASVGVVRWQQASCEAQCKCEACQIKPGEGSGWMGTNTLQEQGRVDLHKCLP
jgi:hypothetical protein